MQLGAGMLLCLLTWVALRRVVGASFVRRPGALLIDAFPVAAGFGLFLLVTARPVLAGLIIVSLGVGLGLADRVKRAILDEPVVFADRSELIEVVRHPRLYLAFIGIGRMIAGAVAIVAVVAALAWIEPPLWAQSISGVVAAVIVAILIGRLLFIVPTWPPLLRALGRLYQRLKPTRDPAEDARRFGLLAACIIQATLARLERPGRQRAAQERAWRPVPAGAGPIVIVQGESFVDVRRLHPDLADSLPHFAQLQRDGACHGRLEVPCWGANTIRSELAVLGGLGPDDIGLDRYNPYEEFARVPLPSLASAARAAGYTTVCIHPYDADFYYRDTVMPLLGFDRFIGIEGFDGAEKHGPYVGDRAVAEMAARLIAEHGPKIFLFAITMENHGPWDAAHDAVVPAPLPEAWRGLPDATPSARWLAHLEATDAMIPILRDAIDRAGGGWMIFYGDHQPSLAGPFEAPGAPDRRTDYAIWGTRQPPGKRADLSAQHLADKLLRVMGGE